MTTTTLEPETTTTTLEPETTTTTLEPETTTTTTPAPDDTIYDGCSTTKLCFGIPNLCPSTRNCRMLATVFYNDGEFEFELLGQSEYISELLNRKNNNLKSF